MTYRPSESEESAARVDGLMARLQKDAEKRGWKFYIQPPPQVTPEFLKGYRPDALGIGPDGGVVIEIKARQREAQRESLAKIANLVEAQKGWDFRVFYVSPPVEDRPDLAAPTVSELASGIAEARVLLNNGHERAALGDCLVASRSDCSIGFFPGGEDQGATFVPGSSCSDAGRDGISRRGRCPQTSRDDDPEKRRYSRWSQDRCAAR